jgi:hypothetical protein
MLQTNKEDMKKELNNKIKMYRKMIKFSMDLESVLKDLYNEITELESKIKCS